MESRSWYEQSIELDRIAKDARYTPTAADYQGSRKERRALAAIDKRALKKAARRAEATGA